MITGATSGSGLATAKQFQLEGGRVAITGQDADRVAQASAALGPSAVAIRADVTSPADMDRVAARLKAEFGGLDIVFANAGIVRPLQFVDVRDTDIDAQFNVNFKGVVYTIQKMMPLLRKPASVILNSSSVAQQGVGGMSIYSATKAALRSLARTLSAELVEQGIRVNVVSPGAIETPLYGKLGLPAEVVKQMASDIISKVPMRRFGQAEEIAKVVLFLASEDSSYVLGESLLVDGGLATV